MKLNVLILLSAAILGVVVGYDKYGGWSAYGECQRPDTGDCAADNTCCNEEKGSKSSTRECLGDDCDPNKDSIRTKACTLRCDKAKKEKEVVAAAAKYEGKWGDFGDWGECKRPTAGECAAEGTCCDDEEKRGVKSKSQVCDGPGECDPAKQKTREFGCKIKCPKEGKYTGKYGDYGEYGECERPESGECSEEGTCCDGDEKKGIKTKTRVCEGPGECDPAKGTTKEWPCKIKCEKKKWGKWGDYGDWGECSRPATGDCSEEGTCCDSDEKVGVKSKQKVCDGPGECDPEKQKTKETNCRITCAPEWGDWEAGECSATCGAGTVKSTRTCSVKGKCEGDAEKTEDCNKGACAAWGAWKDGDCSASCGAGTVKSTRECSGLGDCDGVAEKSAACNKGACAAWGDWKDGDCSATCGAGTVKSTRECSGLGDCDGVAEKSAACNKGACAAWGDWVDGDCSASCGRGTVKSTRECSGLGDCKGVGEKSAACNKGACAAWGAWKDGDCSATCGAGTVKSTRECSGLGDCDGVGEKSAACNKGACAAWGAWKDGDCSATCGAGTVKSTRECSGLGDCDGVAEKSAACNEGDCPATPAPAAACEERPADAEWELMGCFQDGSPLSFTTKVNVKGPMNIQKCRNSCSSKSKTHVYFALRDGNKCFCGDCNWKPKYGKLDIGACGTKCPGSKAKCGGNNKLTVYKIAEPEQEPHWVSPDRMTWQDAKKYCESTNGRLAVESVKVLTQRVEVCEGLDLSKLDNDKLWIGASDIETEGTFKWVTGDVAPSSELHFKETDKPYDAADDCVMIRGGNEWQANDVACTGSFYALCERTDAEAVAPAKVHPCDEKILRCENGAACNKDGDDYTCECADGFTGEHCETKIEWGFWEAGECSTTCGEGTVKSTRTCNVEGECKGDAEKTEACNKGACALWTEWERHGCPSGCEYYTEKWTRTCSEGLGSCDGDDEKMEKCLSLDQCDDILISDTTNPEELMTFPEAWDYCRSQNAFILTIETKEWWNKAIQFVWSHWNKKLKKNQKWENRGFWMWGEYDDATGKIILEHSGKEGYTNWGKGFPKRGNPDMKYVGATNINAWPQRKTVMRNFNPDGVERFAVCMFKNKPMWGEWEAGECSATCGGGEVKSTRTCPKEGECDGDAEKTEPCNVEACPATCAEREAGAEWVLKGCFKDGGFTTKVDVKGPMTITKCKNACSSNSKNNVYFALRAGNQCFCSDCKWEPAEGSELALNACGTKCQGSKMKCGGNGKLTVYEIKGEEAAAPQWSDWVATGTCSATCGEGTLKYTRQCPQDGGSCEGDAEKTETCNQGDCPAVCQRPANPRWNLVGCFQDGTAKGPSFEKKVTVPGRFANVDCRKRCMALSKEYKYAATRDGNKCYCGGCDWEPKYGAAVNINQCNKPCVGAKSVNCGGINKLQVYAIRDM